MGGTDLDVRFLGASAAAASAMGRMSAANVCLREGGNEHLKRGAVGALRCASDQRGEGGMIVDRGETGQRARMGERRWVGEGRQVGARHTAGGRGRMLQQPSGCNT